MRSTTKKGISARGTLGSVSPLVLALASLGGAPSAAQAAEPQARETAAAPAKEAPVKLGPVKVGGEEETGAGYKADRLQSPKLSQPLLDTPKSVTVITRDLIDQRGATSLTEVLRTVPGISLGAGEGGIAAGDRTFIRGYDARGDMYVDGMRDFGSYFRDPFNLESVEIVKGPNAAVGGRGTTGGSINQVSKAPLAESFYDGGVTLGSDETKRLTLDINQVLSDRVAVRLNVMGHDADVAGRDAVTQSRWGVAPSVTLGLGTPTEVTASYMHLQESNMPDYGHPFDPLTGRPAKVDRDNFYGLTGRDDDNATVDVGTLRVSHAFSDSVNLRNQTRYGRTARDLIVTKPEINLTGNVTAPGMVTRNIRNRDSIDTHLVNQTDLTARFTTGGIRHDLVVGLELGRETSENRGRTSNVVSLPAADRANPNPGDPFSLTPVYTGARTEGKLGTIAPYVFDTLSIGEQVELSGGLRYDHVETDYSSIATTGVATAFERTDRMWNWQAGAVFKPLPFGSLYASFGTSSNPSAEYFALSAATVDTDPERSKSYELGTKWNLLDEQLAVTAAIFRTDKTNARINDPLGGVAQVLDGKNRVDGFEISVAGNITRDWRVFGGYTYLDSEILNSATAAEIGKRFANIARDNVSLWTTYRVLPALDLGGGVVYTGKRYANNANTAELPSYWRLDATIGYAVSDHLSVRLNGLNLTNETIYDSTHNGQHALVAPGRSVLLSANFTY